MSKHTVLVINSGSSSIKYQLVDPDTGEAVAKGIVEQIGEPNAHARHEYGDNKWDLNEPIEDHTVGMGVVEKAFEDYGPDLQAVHVVAVGHRVVQGGKYFNGPELIDERVHGLIEELIPLGPLHNPAHLKGIDAAKKMFPELPQVAVFDTAFFQDLPEASATYALNREIADKYSIRRYGAHGTSHQFVSSAVSKFLGRDNLKQIVLHLGNGASASAVVNGHAVDTSMGLTPLEGLVMGTRTGDIDPAAVFHLQRQGGMSVDEIDNLFNKQSGLKGMCGSNDMREVVEMAEKGDPAARLTLDVQRHRLIKYIGAYTAVMGGLDALTFTAGIGENSPVLRERVCERLEYMGVKIDSDLNWNGKGARIISTPDSSVQVVVYPTNEELAIAQQALTLV